MGLSATLESIDNMIENGLVNDYLFIERQEVLKKMSDIEVVEGIDYLQKVKINWGIEGDENSKFFHGMLKRRRKHMQIRGVLSDREWIDEPSSVKNIFFDFHATKFDFFGVIPIIERSHRYNIC